MLGLLVAVPVSLAGFFWAKIIGRRMKAEDAVTTVVEIKKEKLPKTSLAFAPIVVPIVLIALKSISDYPTNPFGDGLFAGVINFVGNPVIALFVGVFLAFKLKTKKTEETHFNWVTIGLKEAGIIILITGAGGAFGAILRATGIGDLIGSGLANYNLGLLLPFIIAALLKTAQGSSTVAIITTAAIIAPVLESFGLDSSVGRALAVLAVGAGAMTVSHLNDSFFWVVAQFTGMDTATALKSQTLSTLFQGQTGIIIVLLLGWIFI
jgi:GntP family gluconate:H+ symporter